MESNGFSIAFIDRAAVISAFECVGINPDYDENTSDELAQQKVDDWERLSPSSKRQVYVEMANLLAPKMKQLKAELLSVLGRQIQIVRVLPLHGTSTDCPSVDTAIDFLTSYSDTSSNHPISKYEIQIRYNNNDKVDGQFQSKLEAISFLKTFQISVMLQLQQLQERLEENEEYQAD